MNESKADILVIGCGNELRGDDALGPRLAAAMAERAWPGVRTLGVHQLTPELGPLLAEQQVVIFIDASVDGDEVTISPLQPAATGQALSHHLDAAGLLALTQSLFGRCPVAWRVAVLGGHFGHGEPLSPAGAGGLGRALIELEKLILASQAPRG